MKVVLRADVSAATYDKVAIISGVRPCIGYFNIALQFIFSGVVPLGFCSKFVRIVMPRKYFFKKKL